MLNGWPVCLAVGTILGFLSGLGIGGGSLLILWLTLVLRADPGDARMINLLFFLPASAAACAFRWKQGSLPWKTVLPAAIAGCLAAGMGTLLGRGLDLGLLRKLFGGLLLVTGVREIFYRPKKNTGGP